jgi:hypothetical protein
MATTNVQAFSGDVEISGDLNITGDVIATAGVDKVNLATDGTNANRSIIFSTGTSGAQPLKTDAGLTYNPSTNKLTVAGGLSTSVTPGSYLTGSAYNGSTARTFAVDATTEATASKIVARNASGDIFARLFRSDYTDQATVSGAIAYRINNSNDNYIRYCNDKGAIRTFLNVPTRTGGDASGTWDIGISGNAGSSTNVRVDRDDTGDTSMYITMVNNATAGNSKRLYMDNGLVYDNTNNRLTLNSINLADYIYHSGDTDTYFGFNAADNFRIVEGGVVALQVNTNSTIDIQSYIRHAGDTDTYFGFDSADHFRIVEGGGTRFQVDSNGRIGIGTTAPAQLLDVDGRIRGNTMEIDSYIYHVGDSDTYFGFDAADHFRIVEGGGNRFQVDSNGRIGIGTSAPAELLEVNGNIQMSGTGKINNASVVSQSSGRGGVLTLGNRRSNTSLLWEIYSYTSYSSFLGYLYYLKFAFDGTTRADITSYGDYRDLYFTGQHGIYITDVNHKNIDNHVGLIVSATNNKYTTTNGKTKSTGKDAITINDAHPVCSLSRVERDKACFGVVSYSEDFDNDTREYARGVFVSVEEKDDTLTWINSLGEGSIWVTNINGNLESGDYITTSSVPGYGMKQDSEFLANYTVAKITMDCDFNPLISIKQVVKTHVVPIEKYVKRILTETNEDDLDVTKIAKSVTQYVYGDDTIDIDAYNALNDDEKQNYSEQNVTKYYNVETRTLTPKEFKEQDEPDGYTLEITEKVKPMIDENGHIMWMDDPSGTLEPAYNVRYLLPDGTQISEAEYTTKALANEEVYIAAFVGCTYHCG